MFHNLITTLNIPPVINVVMLKNIKNENYSENVNLFLYNKDKKILMSLNKKKFWFDNETNSLSFKKKFLNYEEKKNINKITNFMKSLDLYFYSKIKFKGKGFRIRFFKKIRFVKFFFGKSHRSQIFYKKIIVKRINKYKFIMKNINKGVLIKNKKITVKIRPVNLYTLRGIRCSRQMIGKRKGKKGTYI